jgi:hypothetical protein
MLWQDTEGVQVSRQKLRVKNTRLDNLISNLRGEVGEIITSWVLLRHMMARERELTSDDVAKDLANENLVFVSLLRTKLADEIVSRLSELAEAKIGRLTFHFAAIKLTKLGDEVREFSTFISHQRFQEKRNYDISHKELPEEWSKNKHIEIPYRVLLRGIGQAIRVMKTIDGVVWGPAAKHLWREMRKKRYELMYPASGLYRVLPYLNLSREIREQIVMDEIDEGRHVWSDITATIDGQETKIPACRQWGALLLGGRMIVLDHYPLVELTSIQMAPADSARTEEMSAGREPITAERKITAKYRVTKREDSRMSFAPVQREYQLDNGAVTELVDIDINLDDKLRTELCKMNVGDETDFSLTVNVLIGFQSIGQTASKLAG